MRMVLLIAAKEVRHGLNSRFAYLLVLIFSLTLPIPVFWSNGASNVFLNGQATLNPFFAALPLFLMVFIPALAMHSWAGERGAGTLELLLSYPIREHELVLGKFLGNYLVCVACLLGTLMVPILVADLGNLDPGPVIGGYLGALLLAAACLAICLFVGSFTSNHITAFILGILVLASMMFISLPELNLHNRFVSVARGVLDSRDLIFYLCVTCLFLYLNIVRLKLGR